jgi:cytochrome c oxidase assembly protein Cox11
MAGQAIPSYAPMQSASYFQKLECFCFKQQTLAANETRRFPVVFFVDPDLPADVKTDHAVVHVLRGGGRGQGPGRGDGRAAQLTARLTG